MVLGKLPVPGRPAGLGSGGARTYCPCRGCGLKYRLKYSLKGRWTLNNQPNVASLATSLTTQLPAMLEYVKQKLHDVRENEADHVCM